MDQQVLGNGQLHTATAGQRRPRHACRSPYVSAPHGRLGKLHSLEVVYLPIQRQLNLNLNWASIANMPLHLSLFATNVTAEKYYVFTTGASFGFDSAVLNEPRMYGARLKYRFGG